MSEQRTTPPKASGEAQGSEARNTFEPSGLELQLLESAFTKAVFTLKDQGIAILKVDPESGDVKHVSLLGTYQAKSSENFTALVGIDLTAAAPQEVSLSLRRKDHIGRGYATLDVTRRDNGDGTIIEAD